MLANTSLGGTPAALFRFLLAASIRRCFTRARVSISRSGFNPSYGRSGRLRSHVLISASAGLRAARGGACVHPGMVLVYLPSGGSHPESPIHERRYPR
jgi:hypothetical protein